MSSTICPLYNKPFYTYSIDLSNETYSLTFRWSDRLQQWLMDIVDADDNTIIQGVPLVPTYPLTMQYSLEKPTGEFFLMPIEVTSPDIAKPREIYKSHYLVYDDFT